MTVARILAEKGSSVVTVKSDETIDTAIHCLAKHSIGAIIVSDTEGEVTGIISERDIISRVIAKSKDPGTTLVADVMTRDLFVASPDEPWTSCLVKMKRAKVRHLPVLQNDRLVNIISLRDLLQLSIDEKEENIESIHRSLFGSAQF